MQDERFRSALDVGPDPSVSPTVATFSLLIAADHGARLRDLLAHFRRQEADLADWLRAVQSEAERTQQLLRRERLRDGFDSRTLAARCAELECHCEAAAAELMHARMAVLGTQDELSRLVAARTFAAPHPCSSSA